MDRFKEVGYPEGCWGVGGGEKKGREGIGTDTGGREGRSGWVGKTGNWGERWGKTSGERKGERGRSDKKEEKSWRVRKGCEEGREGRGGKVGRVNKRKKG